jgi:hypothetical protein
VRHRPRYGGEVRRDRSRGRVTPDDGNTALETLTGDLFCCYERKVRHFSIAVSVSYARWQRHRLVAAVTRAFAGASPDARWRTVTHFSSQDAPGTVSSIVRHWRSHAAFVRHQVGRRCQASSLSPTSMPSTSPITALEPVPCSVPGVRNRGEARHGKRGVPVRYWRQDWLWRRVVALGASSIGTVQAALKRGSRHLASSSAP